MKNSEQILDILKDGEWHCAVCDFGNLSSQHVAIIRDLANEGYHFENKSDEARKTYKYGISKFCQTCDENRTHRKLILQSK
ncbi:hypothetical protein ACWIWK_01025 [Helicobacter sp. 23-1048]